jgi:hypothetical protein
MPRKRTRTHINSSEKNEKRLQTKVTYEQKEKKEQTNKKKKKNKRTKRTNRTEEKNELLTKERSVHGMPFKVIIYLPLNNNNNNNFLHSLPD